MEGFDSEHGLITGVASACPPSLSRCWILAYGFLLFVRALLTGTVLRIFRVALFYMRSFLTVSSHFPHVVFSLEGRKL